MSISNKYLFPIFATAVLPKSIVDCEVHLKAGISAYEIEIYRQKATDYLLCYILKHTVTPSEQNAIQT